jgi:hypothetical protein
MHLHDEANECAKLLSKCRSELARDYKVTNAAIGFKLKGGEVKKKKVNGKEVPVLAIVVFVPEKKDKERLKLEQVDLLPEKWDDFETDVVEVRYWFRPQQDDNLYRPLVGGVSGSFEKNTIQTGTMGVISENNGKYEILTNNHIGANTDIATYEPSAKRGDFWIQPGWHGSSIPLKERRIATLERWEKLKPYSTGELNYYDAAVGVVVDGQKKNVQSFKIADDFGKGTFDVEGWEDIMIGDRVMKRGRTSLLTRGVVSYFFFQVLAPYTMPGYRTEWCRFRNQIIIEGDNGHFSLGGDSGSLVVSEEPDANTGKHKAKGLLLGGGVLVKSRRVGGAVMGSVVSPLNTIAKGSKDAKGEILFNFGEEFERGPKPFMEKPSIDSFERESVSFREEMKSQKFRVKK